MENTDKTFKSQIIEDIPTYKTHTLVNKLSHEELKAQLEKESLIRKTVSFYKYFHIANPEQFRNEMYTAFTNLKIFGRIYLAHEGINAQISVPEDNFQEFKTYLDSIQELKNLRLNIATDDNGKSFWVLKIKVRNKIVADGINDENFNVNNRGPYVSAEEFNEITKNPDVVVVDMRNHYEYEIGHFENAVEIPSSTFREQLNLAVEMLQDKKEKQIVMYCTGGIRCEKASAWMLHNGFKNVSHLEGGIINYVNLVHEKNLENKFLGKNFVFDNRMAEQISTTIISKCHQCGNPADTHINCANTGCHLLFIQCSECGSKYEQCCSTKCQEIIKLPKEEQKKLRKGIFNGQKIFNKSRRKLSN